MWLWTVDRFQEGCFDALDREPDPYQAACAAARHVVLWSRAHLEDAALLLYGSGECGSTDWSPEHTWRADGGDQREYVSTCGISRLRAKAVSARGATAAQPTGSSLS